MGPPWLGPRSKLHEGACLSNKQPPILLNMVRGGVLFTVLRGAAARGEPPKVPNPTTNTVKALRSGFGGSLY